MRKIAHIFYPSVCWNTGPPGEPTSFDVGKNVISITEHQPKGSGDKWYYDVEFADGHMERLFNVSLVVFEKENK